MRKGFKKAMSFVLSAAMMVSLGSGMTFSTASAEGAADTTKEAAQTTSGSALRYYKARVGFQTDIYTCRDEFKTTADGLAVEKAYAKWRSDNGDPLTDDYNGQNIYYAGNVPDYNSKKQTWRNASDGKTPSQEAARVCTGATVQDVKMSADGEYTVAIKNLDVNKGWKTKEEKEKYALSKAFNMLYVATDIPISDGDNIAVKASSIKVAGKEVATNAVLPLKGDLNKGSNYQFMIADGYTADAKISKDTLFKKDAKAGQDGIGANATELKTPEGEFDIEITFSITGVDWSKAPLDGTEATAAPEPTAAPEATAPPEVTLKTPFDICVSSNMNTALTPKEGARLKANTTDAIQAATFGSEAMKSKIAATKGANGKTILDEAEQDYIVEDSACATITKTGEYTLTVTARGDSANLTDNGAIWIPIMINGSTATMPKDFNLVGKSVKVGDQSYKWGTRMGADSSGDVRLTVYNCYEQDPIKSAEVNAIRDNTIVVHKGDKISFTFYVTADAPAPARTATPEAVVPSTSYMSYLGFQTNDWMFRDNWQADTGLKCKDYDYKKQVAWSHDGKTQAVNVTSITDAKMTKNDVKYKVAIDGLDIQKTSKASTQFNMLYLSTDIPLSMKGVTVKDAVLKIDGKTIKNYKVVPNKGDASKYYQFMLADAYAPSDGTKDAPYPDGKTLKTLPKKSIEVEYTISGVDFNSKTVTVGNFKYKLTKNTAQVVGLSKAGKKKANLSLGKTIKVASASAVSTQPAVKKTYKVTSVKAGAFKGSSKLKSFSFKKAVNIKKLPAKAFMNCKKLKKVELNKNMKSIPAKAFSGCKKLSTIKCNAKLKSASKSAFKGCKKKIKIAGKSAKANKKKIKKAYKKVK